MKREPKSETARAKARADPNDAPPPILSPEFEPFNVFHLTDFEQQTRLSAVQNSEEKLRAIKKLNSCARLFQMKLLEDRQPSEREAIAQLRKLQSALQKLLSLLPMKQEPSMLAPLGPPWRPGEADKIVLAWDLEAPEASATFVEATSEVARQVLETEAMPTHFIKSSLERDLNHILKDVRERDSANQSTRGRQTDTANTSRVHPEIPELPVDSMEFSTAADVFRSFDLAARLILRATKIRISASAPGTPDRARRSVAARQFALDAMKVYERLFAVQVTYSRVTPSGRGGPTVVFLALCFQIVGFHPVPRFETLSKWVGIYRRHWTVQGGDVFD
jgi:hypothetical protein